MKRTEICNLLKIIAAFVANFDPLDENKITNWRRVLGNRLTYAEAEAHMIAHFENSRFIPMPADIIQRYRESFDPDKLVPLDPPPFLDEEGKPL